MEFKNVVVFGGDGFMGSHLVDALLPVSGKVRVMARMGNGHSNNLEHARDQVELVRGDFANPNDVESVLQGVDTVVHCISATTPASSANDASLDVTANLLPTIALLDLCVKYGIRNIVFASSGGAVYGNTDAERIAESHPTNPVSPYGIGKLAIEHYLGYYRARHGLRPLVLRYSNPYGPRQNPLGKQGIVGIFLHSLLTGKPVTLYGKGDSVRDYIHVDDAIGATVLLMRKFFGEGGDTLPSLYNVGSGQGTSVRELMDIMEEVTGKTFVCNVLPERVTDVRRIVLDVTRLHKTIGTTETTDLKEGIKRLYEDGTIASV